SWDLLRDLKSDPATASIPVFVVTVVENREKAVSLGADAFQVKPVERTWLVEQLQAAVDRDSPREVLIIDDDEISRYLLRNILGETNSRFVEAAGAKEGLAKAREGRPDAVILDLAMPDLSGFEVLRRLKDDPHTAAIPVIVYTSRVLGTGEREMLRDA